jgi:hypothetical protein
MHMSHPLLPLVAGLVSCALTGLILWYAAMKTRDAGPGSAWENGSRATFLCLGLVAFVIIAAAWTMRGMMTLVSNQLVGAALGFVASAVVVLVTMRLLSGLTNVGKEIPPAPASHKP